MREKPAYRRARTHRTPINSWARVGRYRATAYGRSGMAALGWGARDQATACAPGAERGGGAQGEEPRYACVQRDNAVSCDVHAYGPRR